MDDIKAYCVKCKDTRVMVDPKKEKTANGRSMLKGTCKVCGTKMCKFISSAPMPEGAKKAATPRKTKSAPAAKSKTASKTKSASKK